MKVLFISSGNNIFGISPIVFNQGQSLQENNVNIEFYTIKGKGLLGYLKNVLKIRTKIKMNKYNLIHAHYSLSAFVATLSFPHIPLIVSLMGSDSKMNIFWKFAIKIGYYLFWQKVIVKSEGMKNNLKLSKAIVIPNGVKLDAFDLTNKLEAKKKLGWDLNRRHILFLSNPARHEKNYKLADTAVKLINDKLIELIPVFNKEYSEIHCYLSASDILVITSLWEGSPNVVKEAMACNLPIVSTDVGDVRWLFGKVPGHFISSFDSNDVADKIKDALYYSIKYVRTSGRKRIIELGLDSQTVALKIINVYKDVLKRTF